MTCIKNSFSLLLYLALCGFMAAYAQPVSLTLTAFNSSNGLSQNTINVCYKDHIGFMWFGTQDGLNKYDGYKVTVYKHRSGDGHSLPANYIAAIFEDATGNLWIGTRMGGLSRYNRASDSFTNYRHNDADEATMSNNNIECIYEDRSHNFWIGTDKGLNLRDSKTGRFKHYFHNDKDSSSISSSVIYSIFESSDGKLWIGTTNGVNQLNRTTGKFIRIEGKGPLDKKAGTYIYTIKEDDAHNLWIGTDKGLTLFNKQSKMLSYFTVEPDKNSADGTNPVYCIAKSCNNPNAFWLGTNTTLQLFDINKKQLIPLSDKTPDYNLMPNDAVYSLLQDNAGILWIGTSSQGILKHDEHLTTLPTFGAAYRTTPTAKNIIRSMAEDSKGNLYLATDAGLVYYNRHDYTSTVYRHNKQTANSLLSNYTTDVIVSKSGDAIWIGTSGIGLDRLNLKTGVFKHYTKGNSPQQLSSNTISVLLEDKQGNIWIGTSWGGLNVYDPVTNTFTKYLHDPKNPQSLCDNVIQALYEDRNGNIWIGGYSNGVSIFNSQKRTFTQLNTRNSKLTSDVISDFYEDAKGCMWIGTMEAGLNCYNPQTKKFTSITEASGLIDNTVNSVLGDRKGFLWLATNQGLTRFDPAKKSFRNLGFYNSLKTLEFNIGSGITLSTGEIAVGSINGFNIINPDKVPLNPNEPPVVFTGFELFNKPVAIGTKNSPLRQSILTTKTITLNYAQSVFTIEFAALDYTVPELNQYAYKLEGFDDNWLHAGNRRRATYTNLSPGTYTFKVKAANNDGVWNANVASLTIIVNPPYWMTWWFRTLALLCLAAIIYAVYINRKRQKDCLKQLEEEKFKATVNAVVNAQEEERRRIAEALHNDFGQLLFLAKMNIPAQHTEASKILNEAINKVRSISYELMPPILADYGLEYALKDMMSKKLKDEHIRYSAVITGLKNRINQLMEVTIYRIIQELLNNVVKHSKANFVEMKIVKEDTFISISLNDNGVGLTNFNGSAVKTSKEFGLNYITNRVHLLKGTIDINGEHNGTSIAIRLPLQ